MKSLRSGVCFTLTALLDSDMTISGLTSHVRLLTRRARG